jgi:ribose 5-phosphate isomerase B
MEKKFMNKIKIAIGSDHAAFEIKRDIVKYLDEKGYLVSDEGTYSLDSCDYPDYAKKVGFKVRDKVVDLGILICGTGIGMSISANKIKGIRASLCFNEYMAEMARIHNNANVLCLGARVLKQEEIVKIIDKWLESKYEGGRHDKRLAKITEIEGC